MPAAAANPILLVATVAACTVTAGCRLGPDPVRPELKFDLTTTFAGSTLSEVDGETAAVDPRWWRRFGDNEIDRLVDRSIGGNFDLRAALARARQARAAREVARGDRLPSAGLNASATGQRIGDAGFFPGVGGAGGGAPVPGGGGGGGDDFIEFYDLSLDVSWQTDLFGRLARLEQAAAFDESAARLDALALAHTLVARTIQGRVAVATLQTRVRLAEENVESLKQTLEVVDGRYSAGVGDPVELRLARENVASAEATVHPLQAELAAERYALDVLTGIPPQRIDGNVAELTALPSLPPPPVGLPAALLDRRPDLLASDFRARAAKARVGASIAAMFPDLTLSASAGSTSDMLDDLLDDGNFVYSIVGRLAQPIFQGGSLRAGVRQSRAGVDEAVASYAGLVLVAMREVSEALVRERGARNEAEALTRALAEAEAAESLARERYGRGVGDLLLIFEAERRRRAAEERLALARQLVWNARINLHLALGGDWDLPETGEPMLDDASTNDPS
ncbi:MAG: efflux transporter outer membrane subunit [Planctomycetota bacterium]